MDVLTKIVGIILNVLLVWLFLRRGLVKDREWLLVSYSRTIQVFSIIVVSGSAWLLYSALFSSPSPRDGVLVILIGFIALSLLFTWETYRRKIWFNGVEVHYQSPYGEKLTFELEEIALCKVVHLGNTFRIVTKNGRKIDFSPYMAGAVEFYNMVSSYLKSRDATRHKPIDRQHKD